MRSWLIVFIFIFSLQPSAFARPYVDIVFDLDWTSFYTIDPLDPQQNSEKNIVVEGKIYRPTDYLTRVVETLLKTHPEIRISFFSGGEKSRNEALLNSQRLSDGRSLKDIAYRLLSKEHLTMVSQNETLKFTVRFKKILDSHISDWSSARTILIDDQINFAKPPLKAVSSLGRTTYQSHFSPENSDKKHFPLTKIDWERDRNKALIWLAMIDMGFFEAERTNKDFSLALQEVWLRHSQDGLMIPRGKRLLSPVSISSCEKIFAF